LTYRTCVRYDEGMIQVQLGYAADLVGNGVAYARLASRTGERLVRAAFHVQRCRGLDDREVGYAALTAVATLLSKHGLDRASFVVPDGELVKDRNEHRAVPPPIVIPYVRLGCSLNHFKSYSLEYGEDPDLLQRARAEVALSHAA
jgi:hypothetical protein